MKKSVYNLHNASLSAFYKDAKKRHEFYRKSEYPSRNMVDFISDFFKDNVKDDNIDEKWISNFYKNFSKLQRKPTEKYTEILRSKYYKSITKAIEAGNSISVFNSEISKLQNLLKSDDKISENKRMILNSAMNIAKESYEYWVKNSEKWATLGIEYFGKDQKRSLSSNTDRGQMAQADVEGAAGGALTGLFTGGPAGALIGATLGAAWSSAIDGAAQHFNWSWSWD